MAHQYLYIVSRHSRECIYILRHELLQKGLFGFLVLGLALLVDDNRLVERDLWSLTQRHNLDRERAICRLSSRSSSAESNMPHVSVRVDEQAQGRLLCRIEIGS